MMAGAETCFHCALPIPANCNLTVTIDDEQQPVCCPGCKAVAELIRDAGMSQYYALREAPAPGVGRPPAEATEWQVFDTADMLSAFTESTGDDTEATLYVGGVYCSACSWLIESTLMRLPGVAAAELNPVTHRLRVRWQPAENAFSDVLGALASHRLRAAAADG